MFELLVHDARRVIHLQGTLAHELLVRRQQRVRARGPAVRSPFALPGPETHRLAIQLQPPGNLGHRQMFLDNHASDRLPTLLVNHALVSRLLFLDRHDAQLQLSLLQHELPSFEKEDGENSMTTTGIIG